VTYEIIYRNTQTNEQHTIEWIAPTGWSQDAIRECFEQRNSAAEVLFIKAKQ
jgi:hypothetical protein